MSPRLIDFQQSSRDFHFHCCIQSCTLSPNTQPQVFSILDGTTGCATILSTTSQRDLTYSYPSRPRSFKRAQTTSHASGQTPSPIAVEITYLPKRSRQAYLPRNLNRIDDLPAPHNRQNGDNNNNELPPFVGARRIITTTSHPNAGPHSPQLHLLLHALPAKDVPALSAGGPTHLQSLRLRQLPA